MGFVVQARAGETTSGRVYFLRDARREDLLIVLGMQLQDGGILNAAGPAVRLYHIVVLVYPRYWILLANTSLCAHYVHAQQETLGRTVTDCCLIEQQWMARTQRMTPHQEDVLERLAQQYGVHLPFLDPASPRFNKCPSKADAARLIAMLVHGHVPLQELLESMPEVPHEDIMAPYKWPTANDQPSEMMLAELQADSLILERMGGFALHYAHIGGDGGVVIRQARSRGETPNSISIKQFMHQMITLLATLCGIHLEKSGHVGSHRDDE
ncbi:hypothetical protein CERSUDRAFT_74161 [Gelatoporia subvermispora B]|uniref:Uncharacterized protein n=1 Tax=Ceriporiopsis subvermispora (strain B) TaxID=914234 RepID=M2PLG1_CERS8|nr:hypothetical protein CERSUDRAFT_74161 [Gelatoporia subvermispora B]